MVASPSRPCSINRPSWMESRSFHPIATHSPDTVPDVQVSSDDYPLWLRGSPPPPAVTYIALNGETRSLKGTIRTEHQLLDRLTALMLIGLIGIGLVLRRCSFLPSM